MNTQYSEKNSVSFKDHHTSVNIFVDNHPNFRRHSVIIDKALNKKKVGSLSILCFHYNIVLLPKLKNSKQR